MTSTPRMTLNGHFALKLCLGLVYNGMTCSGFQTKLLGNLHSYADTVSSKNVAQKLQFLVI